MDDATLLELEALKAEALGALVSRIGELIVLKSSGKDPEAVGLEIAERIRALKSPPTEAPIDDPSDPVVPGNRERWELRALQNRLATIRALVQNGEVKIDGGRKVSLAQQLWRAVNGTEVPDLVGLLIKTLPELPPDLEEDVAAALKEIGVEGM